MILRSTCVWDFIPVAWFSHAVCQLGSEFLMCRSGILMSWVSTGKTRSDPLHSQTLGNKSRNPLPPLIQVLLCLYGLRTNHVKISLSPWAILLHRPSHKFLAWELSFYLGTVLLCQPTQTQGILVSLITIALLPLSCLIFSPTKRIILLSG